MLDSIKTALQDERFTMRSVKGIAKQAEMDENEVYIDLTAAVAAGDVVQTDTTGTTREPKFGLKSRVWDKVKAALEDERYLSRSLRGLALQAGIASSAVLTVLTEQAAAVPAVVAVTEDGRLYALVSRIEAEQARQAAALEGDWLSGIIGVAADDEDEDEDPDGFGSFRRNNPFLS